MVEIELVLEPGPRRGFVRTVGTRFTNRLTLTTYRLGVDMVVLSLSLSPRKSTCLWKVACADILWLFLLHGFEGARLQRRGLRGGSFGGGAFMCFPDTCRDSRSFFQPYAPSHRSLSICSYCSLEFLNML